MCLDKVSAELAVADRLFGVIDRKVGIIDRKIALVREETSLLDRQTLNADRLLESGRRHLEQALILRDEFFADLENRLSGLRSLPSQPVA